MYDTPMRLHARLLPTLALFFVTAAAHAAGPSKKPARAARVQPGDVRTIDEQGHGRGPRSAHRCAAPPVEVSAGSDASTFSLVQCDGTAAPLGLTRLSILARPAEAPRPKRSAEQLAHERDAELAPGVRRLDPGLAERLARVVDRFRKPGETARVALVSGYRTRDGASYHARGRALDFRMEGVDNAAIIAFCKTLADTGCGYYPNSTFVHIDVRDPGTGHVAWTDLSRPGEPPRYVQPAPDGAAPADTALPALPPRSDDADETAQPEPARAAHAI